MRAIFGIVLTIISFTSNILAQEFKITDCSTLGGDPQEKNEWQRDWLGGSVSLVFFDRTVKLEKFYNSKGAELTGMIVPILEKVDDNTYSFTDKKSKTVLKLEKLVGYIRNATIYVDEYKGQTTISGMIKLTRK